MVVLCSQELTVELKKQETGTKQAAPDTADRRGQAANLDNRKSQRQTGEKNVPPRGAVRAKARGQGGLASAPPASPADLSPSSRPLASSQACATGQDGRGAAASRHSRSPGDLPLLGGDEALGRLGWPSDSARRRSPARSLRAAACAAGS